MTAPPAAVPPSSGAAGATAATAAPTATAPKPIDPALNVLLPPRPSPSAPPASQALLVVVPGVGLGPADFLPTAQQLQAACPHVQLWVGLLHVDWLGLFKQHASGPGASFEETFSLLDQRGVWRQALADVRAQAQAAGFEPRMAAGADASSKPWAGRNVWVLAQSAAGRAMLPVAAASAEDLGGMVLLGTAQGSATFHRHLFGPADVWSRPYLTLAGDLDGQSRWFWYAHHAHELALAAARYGPRYAAAHKGLVLLPGVNHALTSNGLFKVPYGDANIPELAQAAPTGDVVSSSDNSNGISGSPSGSSETFLADLDTARSAIVAAVSAFITAHQAADPAAAQAASLDLGALVASSAALAAPYTKALGFGDVSAAFSQSRAAWGGKEGAGAQALPDPSGPAAAAYYAHSTAAASAPVGKDGEAVKQAGQALAELALNAAAHGDVLSATAAAAVAAKSSKGLGAKASSSSMPLPGLPGAMYSGPASGHEAQQLLPLTHLPGGLVSGASREYAAPSTRSLHPGLLSEAESFAHWAQQQVLLHGGMPAETVAQMRIAVTVHTQPTMLALQAPRIVRLHAAPPPAGASGAAAAAIDGEPLLLLHVHTALHFTSNDPSPATNPMPYTRPMAPEYWTPLITPAAVAAALAPPAGGGAAAAAAAAVAAGYVTAVDYEGVVRGLAQCVLDRALQLSPARARARYTQYGKQLVVGARQVAAAAAPTTAASEGASAAADGAASTPVPAAQHLLANERINFAPALPPAPGGAAGNSRHVHMSVPYALQQAAAAAGASGAFPPTGCMGDIVLRPGPLGPASTGIGAAAGPNSEGGASMDRPATADVLTLKLPSVAQLMEWVGLDSLRVIDSPW